MTVAPRLAASGARRLGRVAAGAEERDVDALERLRGRLGDDVFRPVDVDAPAGAARAGQQAQLPEREATLQEHPDHRPADDAGGADDRDGQGFGGH